MGLTTTTNNSFPDRFYSEKLDVFKKVNHQYQYAPSLEDVKINFHLHDIEKKKTLTLISVGRHSVL
jgi:hypothetical protein